jgi:DNA-binding FadR family transcriptional regulator
MYSRVAEQIAKRITSGEFEPGERLPSERELAQAYRVSRPTMREAVIALEVDGLIEVRQGAGMFVISSEPRNGRSAFLGVGPFELLEARRAVESEACALAALRAQDGELDAIASLLEDMRGQAHDFVAAEAIDRRFHVQIARASQNSALLQAVEALWEARLSSPQQKLLSEKAHDAGIGPRIDEHDAILSALRSRDQKRARTAMRVHLNRVLESLISATEVQETRTLEEQSRARRRMLTVDE